MRLLIIIAALCGCAATESWDPEEEQAKRRAILALAQAWEEHEIPLWEGDIHILRQATVIESDDIEHDCKAEHVAGCRYVGDVIYVWSWDDPFVLLHEYTHVLLDHITGDPDSDHSDHAFTVTLGEAWNIYKARWPNAVPNS